MKDQRLAAEHGIVCRVPGTRLGYFGWPTVARMDDGTLVVVSSGLRFNHIDPWGKGVLNVSPDDGRTWSPPRVIHDTPLDDRDGGIVSLGGRKLLVTWFCSDTRKYESWCREHFGEEELERWRATMDTWTDSLVDRWLGSRVALSDDGGDTWSEPIRVPVNSPHGPIRLHSGKLLYLGKRFTEGWSDFERGPILSAESADGGRTWTPVGEVPLVPGTGGVNYHEAHAAELPSGKLIGTIRVQNYGVPGGVEKAGIVDFSILQTESTDGGRTWTMPRPLGFHGSPPHLVRHSSGVLVLSYGYRLPLYGQRVAFSRDEGKTWEHDWIIRDDGPNLDLGYPSTVELADNSLFTVYYQRYAEDTICSLLWSRWRLPT